MTAGEQRGQPTLPCHFQQSPKRVGWRAERSRSFWEEEGWVEAETPGGRRGKQNLTRASWQVALSFPTFPLDPLPPGQGGESLGNYFKRY